MAQAGQAQVTIQEKVVDYIGYTSAAMEKASAEMATITKQAAQRDALIPTVVKALLDHGCIRPEQEKEAAEALKDPVRALEILTKVATRQVQPPSVAPMGVPTGGNVKSASHTPFRAIGAHTDEMRESDRILWERIVGRAPAN